MRWIISELSSGSQLLCRHLYDFRTFAAASKRSNVIIVDNVLQNHGRIVRPASLAVCSGSLGGISYDIRAAGCCCNEIAENVVGPGPTKRGGQGHGFSPPDHGTCTEAYGLETLGPVGLGI